MIEYEARVVAMVVGPKGDPLFSERATRIEIVDEAAGEYVRVSQVGGHTCESKFLLVDPEEWSTVRAAIDTLVAACRDGID